jgi:hypothetical protein
LGAVDDCIGAAHPARKSTATLTIHDATPAGENACRIVVVFFM